MSVLVVDIACYCSTLAIVLVPIFPIFLNDTVMASSACVQWNLTWNNYPANWMERIDEHYGSGMLRYVVAGEEVAPTTGTPHLQMYIQLTTRKRANFVKSMFMGAWVGPVYKTPLAAIKYCKKDGKYIERGVAVIEMRASSVPVATPDPSPSQPSTDNQSQPPTPLSVSITPVAAAQLAMFDRLMDGLSSLALPRRRTSGRAKRTRSNVVEHGEERKWTAREIGLAAIEGRLSDIPIEERLKRATGIKCLASGALTSKPALNDNPDFCGLWVYGAVNTGKSYLIKQAFPGAFRKIKHSKWWDGYNYEPFVTLDELGQADARTMMSEFKNWTDVAPFAVEVKGGTMLIRPRAIVVGSNWSIDELYPGAIDNAAMKKRFKEVHLTHQGQYTAEYVRGLLGIPPHIDSIVTETQSEGLVPHGTSPSPTPIRPL